MSISKFIGEQDNSHGGPLHWPGFHGVPVRGQTGLVKDSEFDAGFQVVYDFHHKDFDLADAEQAAEYNRVMDRIVNGWYVKLEKQPHRDPTTGHMMVYLEWAQQYGQIDPDLKRRLGGSSIPKVG